MNEDKQKKETQKKVCPFNETLECKSCRLFMPYLGGAGQWKCVFDVISEELTTLILKG